MEIFEYDGFDDTVNTPSVDDIKAEGITVRSGNKLLKFTVSEEVVLPEDELKQEYSERMDVIVKKLTNDCSEYRTTLKTSYDMKVQELDEKLRKLRDKERSVSVLPDIHPLHASQGLSVVSDGDKIIWYFNCVYNPKYVNEQRIEPAFAKRLMTPITIAITTINDKVSNLKVKKIIGHEKFHHYHSMSNSSDCWGGFSYSGDIVNDADQALVYARKVLLLLDTINEFSLGRRNPKGLSRFNTIKNHLLEKDEVSEDKKTQINSRNARSGFNTDINDEISNDMVWNTHT